MKKIYVASLAAIFVACQNSEEAKQEKVERTPVVSEALFAQATSLFKPLPENAADDKHVLTDEKIALGKKLYYDTKLSKEGNNSCNSCHNLETFGVDNKPTSVGDNGGFGDRNSPTVLNAALHIAQFWDGRAADVEEQAGGPVLNPVEMAMPSEIEVVKRLKAVPEYQALFAAAFPDDAEPISYANMQNAIGAFERTLLTPTRWDKFLAGDKNALNEKEVAGLSTFIDAGCITCHTGVNLGGHMYQKFGLIHPYWEYTKSEKIDEGRYTITQNEGEKYIFKVPGLRNVTKTGPYFHDGSVADLGEAVKIMAKVQLNKDLTDQEVSSILIFLEALTGTVPASALPENTPQS